MSEAMNPRNPVDPMEQGSSVPLNDQGMPVRPVTPGAQGTPVPSNDPGTPARPVTPGTQVTPMAQAQGAPPRSMSQGQGTPARPTSQGSQAMVMEDRGVPVLRPGMVTFAAVMIFLLAGFQLVWAIVEFVNVAWLASVTYGTFNGYLWLWAIFDLVLAAVLFYAGYDILRGGTFGRVLGVIIAGISAIRWFFYLPAAPWIGVVMIAVDILIIYALVAHSEFFDAASAP
jgi:hypothetical protein